jgi:hypothetical protein
MMTDDEGVVGVWTEMGLRVQEILKVEKELIHQARRGPRRLLRFPDKRKKEKEKQDRRR